MIVNRFGKWMRIGHFKLAGWMSKLQISLEYYLRLRYWTFSPFFAIENDLVLFVAFLNVIIIVGTEFYFDDLISTLLFDNAMFFIGEYFCVNTFDVSQTNKNTEKKWKKNRNERERTKNHIKRNNENNVENLMRMLNQHTERERHSHKTLTITILL